MHGSPTPIVDHRLAAVLICVKWHRYAASKLQFMRALFAGLCVALAPLAREVDLSVCAGTALLRETAE
jgi:hypothetical protein